MARGDEQQAGAPPGWFPSPDPEHAGRFARYWDGSRWTEHLVEIDATTSSGPPRQPSPSVRPPAPSPPEAAAPDRQQDEDGQPRRRRWTRIPLVVLVLGVLVLGAALLVETIPADGPVGYSLTDETSRNRIVNLPSVRASVGTVSHSSSLTPRTDQALTRIGGVRWNRSETLTIEFVPFYPEEQGTTIAIDVRGNGTNAFAQDRFVRIDVVARDDVFEITVRQPILRGTDVVQQVVHEESVRRGNEAALAARFAARQAAEREALEQRAECEASETMLLASAAAPILELERQIEEIFERLGIFSQESISLDRWLRNLRTLVNELRADNRAASDALDLLTGPLADVAVLSGLIEAHERHTEAWETYRERLEAASRIPGRELRFDDEFIEIATSRDLVTTRRLAAEMEVTRIFVAETRRTCEARHPLP